MKSILSRSILLAFSIFLFSSLIAQNTQNLFMNKAYKKALLNKTRSLTGKPGNDYWQNHADYKINASFDAKTRMISGEETITYSNNSPDTLRSLYFDLIQDLYKKGTARDWDLGQVDLHDGVNIKFVEIDGEAYEIAAIYRNASKMVIKLKKNFAPKTKHSIEIHWDLIIPGTRTVRMGTYHKTNFMIAYWFPKMAVYDDLWGWAREPHTGNCEYYNEFGNYDVAITMKSPYILWSTGLLQNKDDIFQKNILKRIVKSVQTDKVVHIVTTDDLANEVVLKKADAFVWKFRAVGVPDFAFAVSKDYIWDATSVESGGRRVMINAVYKRGSLDFKNVADVAHKSIKFFSEESPKIAFPYPQITIFNGAGGMEFPGMVNDGDSRDYTGTLYVTAHEIGHSYFPFNTGLNEQFYAWMDEGLITFLPRKIVGKYTNDSSYVAFVDIIKSYNKYAGSIREIPLMIPSTNTGFAYRYQAYTRSSVAFYSLSEYLGADKFDLALQEFSRRWEQKHPTPYDFFNTFNEVAGEDLAWFWKPWFFELAYADLALEVVNNQEVTVINKGGFPVAIHLKITWNDGTEEHFSMPASVWKNGRQKYSWKFKVKEFEKLELDTKLTPDAFPNDNVWIADK